ncbi:hypothetical protein B0H14DRAFT_3441312 [Mycena olivaceomarginata]|nr:hypothetical protein B0H14DRAFT_3441312 [Mycena olivaceomarginata]
MFDVLASYEIGRLQNKATDLEAHRKTNAGFRGGKDKGLLLRVPDTPRPDFRAVDWDTFNKALEKYLAAHPISTEINSTTDYDAVYPALDKMLQTIMSPSSRPPLTRSAGGPRNCLAFFTSPAEPNANTVNAHPRKRKLNRPPPLRRPYSFR